ncbi:N/A [soil metagenome]
MNPIAAECVHRDSAIVGECPVWDEDAGLLWWVDIQGRKLHRYHPGEGRDEEVELEDIVTSVHRRAAGGLVLTLRKRIVFYDWETARLEVVAEVESDRPGNRFNDAACDPQGRLWAGTMNSEHWDQPEGALYRLDATRRVEQMRTGVICSNGTGWSPDGRTLYHTESFRYAVLAYDFEPETGTISNRRAFLQLDPDGGEFPDGLTVDAEGGVWSAHVGRGRIVRYDPAGQAEREVQLPVTRGTSCAFGAASLSTLYITTARETLTPAQLADEPLAGSLFACEPGVRGCVGNGFAG